MSQEAPFPLSRAAAQAVDVVPTSEMTTQEKEQSEMLDGKSPARTGLITLAVFLGGFLLWAAVVPLDEGVPTQGMVSIDTKRRVVQHFRGGIIKEVFVKEGQFVKKGDLLMKLDPELAKASFESTNQQLASLRENLVSQQAILEGLKQAEGNRRSQLELFMKELAGIRDLVKDGFAPVVQQLQLERSIADVQTAIADNKINQQRTSQAIAEMRNQINAVQQAKKANAEDLERFEIRSPVDGQVVGLSAQSVGAVIQPAQRIMDIVPKDENLLIETRVPPISIDRIKVGDSVDVRFSSFARSPMLVVEGQLQSISKDALTDPNTGITYYLARVQVTPQGIKDLGNREMQAGMPADVVIKTGSRTMLNYLLYPLTRRIATSLTEE